jgi:hypothetical protein
MHQIGGGLKFKEVQLLHSLKLDAPQMVVCLKDCRWQVNSTVNFAKGLEDLGFMLWFQDSL